MRNIILTLFLMALLPNAAIAFKMPSVPGAPGAAEESEEKDGSKESTVSAADSQDALVAQFKETLGSILLAQRHQVVGLDISKEKISLLNQKKSPIKDDEIDLPPDTFVRFHQLLCSCVWVGFVSIRITFSTWIR